MKIVAPVVQVPAGEWWSAADIPPQCEPVCGVPIEPVGYIVVWHASFTLDVESINPWTNQPWFRHMMHCNSFYYFMNQSGCWSASPPGYRLNPHPETNADLTVETKFANSHEIRWRLIMAEMYTNGATPPRTYVPLPELARRIPGPANYQ